MSVKRTSELDPVGHLSAGGLFDISEDQGDTTYISKKITAANTVSYITTGLAKLDGTNHSNGAPSANPFALAVGFHVQMDTIGSRTEWNK